MREDAALLSLLRSAGALRRGHFVLTSGRHSDQYVEKFDLLRRPAATEAACARIVDAVRDLGVEVVVGPTTGGIILAFEVGRQLGVDAAYAERRDDGTAGREFRRGTTFEPGRRALVVDDILTTGKSVRETLAALALQPVSVAGVAVLVDRSGGTVDFGVPLFSLLELAIETWDAVGCPLCAAGEAVVKPGSAPRGG